MAKNGRKMAENDRKWQKMVFKGAGGPPGKGELAKRIFGILEKSIFDFFDFVNIWSKKIPF